MMMALGPRTLSTILDSLGDTGLVAVSIVL